MPTHTESKKTEKNPAIDAMFNVGAHYGFIKSRRHPTIKSFIFGVKNKVEIFDLDKTQAQLESALEFIKNIAASGKQVVFIGSKSEAKEAIKNAADRIAQPSVASRWIGGTFTNFEIIRKRVEKLLDLISQKEKGELNKYTKKERVMIDRDIEKLTSLFGGITTMTTLPGAIFVADPKKEYIAVAEAIAKKIPVVALSGADCDISIIKYPIVANDSSVASIAFFADKVAEAYSQGKAMASSKANADKAGADKAVEKVAEKTN